MNKEELFTHILDSNIFKTWHWFNWHFQHTLKGVPQPFADSLIEACLICEKIIPGFAISMIDNIASISGREKDERQYEQLIQRLAELHIIKQILTYNWPNQPKFQWEPTTHLSKKNPEITIAIERKIIGVEVKAPSLLQHYKNLRANSTQLLSRARDVGELKVSGETIVLPRDNPIKDFLISANGKFQPFKNENPEFLGVLVIVWDEAIKEPLSALLSPASGLLTKNSFAKDEQGNPLSFPNIDCIVIVSHLHQIMRATKDEALLDYSRHAFDYGSRDGIPFKVLIPLSPAIPESFLDCMQVYLPDPHLGSEYMPSDFIWWIAPKNGEG